MTHPTTPLRRIAPALLLVGLIASGCAADQPAADAAPADEPAAPAAASTAPPPASKAAGASHTAKKAAPVDVRLTTTGKSGMVEATLAFEATADIPRAVARIVVPAGVELVSGQPEQDMGAVAAGESRAVTVTLEIPDAGSYRLAGGVDCHMARGIKVHGGTTLALGTGVTPAPKTEVVQEPGGGGAIRMGTVK